MRASQRSRQSQDPRHAGKCGPDLESVSLNVQIRALVKTEAALLRVQVTQGSEKRQLLYCRRRHNYGARTEAGGTLPHNGYTPTVQGKRAGKTEA